jgi:mannose-6-phosphate isomerase-like protein (cupin superfamily)
MPRSIILSLALIAAPPLTAQTVHTTADLKQHEAKLLATAKASPTGLASEIMDDYGNDRTMLIVRVHTGGSERHQFWADQMVIESGTITLIIGGTMQQEHPNGASPGETIGDGVDGGKEVVLHAGDIAHIPANIPHWVKIAPGTTTTYLIFKEKEK